jgi:hypothetical protein
VRLVGLGLVKVGNGLTFLSELASAAVAVPLRAFCLTCSQYLYSSESWEKRLN